MKLKVNVEVYGKLETVEASDEFWLKVMCALSEAAEYNMEYGYSGAARDCERLHDEIYKQTRHEIMKMEEN